MSAPPMNALIQVVRSASPYLAIELLLPGGSVIALLLWLFRHRFKKGAAPLGARAGRLSTGLARLCSYAAGTRKSLSA